MDSNLPASFAALPAEIKAQLLADAIHELTIAGRSRYQEANCSEYLMSVNEAVHRVVGYLILVLDGEDISTSEHLLAEMLFTVIGNLPSARLGNIVNRALVQAKGLGPDTTKR